MALAGIAIEGIGNLSLFQYQSLLRCIEQQKKEQMRDRLIAARAAQTDSDTFSSILDSYED